MHNLTYVRLKSSKQFWLAKFGEFLSNWVSRGESWEWQSGAERGQDTTVSSAQLIHLLLLLFARPLCHFG